MMQNWNIPWPCVFKIGIKNWVNFHYSTQKSEKLYTDGLYLSKAYNASARKFQRNYVMTLQNLKENWLVTWKMTSGIWLIFMRAVQSLKICTLIGSFCPKHTKIWMKKYRRIMSHDTKVWCRVWRKTGSWFQKWQEEFGEF